MAVKGFDKKISAFLKKYKYVFIVLFIGLALMSFPNKSTETKELSQSPESTLPEKTSASEELARILSQVQGAGDVQVLLTVAAGEETLYQTDEEYATSSDSESTQITTVTISDAQKDEQGLIRQINPPVYMGAIIVCKGADDPQVRLAIVTAVSNATGLGADRITVLKMK